jgi:peptidyl-prolyl cis-trans isomerase C
MGNRITSVVAGTLLACCVAVLPFSGGAAENENDKILARVGKVTITQSELEARLTMLPPQFRARYDSPEGRRNLLEQTITYKLLAQEARRLGIDKQAEVSRKIQEATDSIIVQELTQQEISGRIVVSEEDVRAYYEANRAGYSKPETVNARLIFFEAKDGAGADVRTQQKNKADKALKRLKAGEDFDALAKELSDDSRTKRRGGTTGFFARGRRAKVYGDAFEQQAFSLKPGELSPVFAGKDGWYILTVVEKKDAYEQTLDEVRSRIERTLHQEQQKGAYDRYVESLKKKYPVEVFD